MPHELRIIVTVKAGNKRVATRRSQAVTNLLNEIPGVTARAESQDESSSTPEVPTEVRRSKGSMRVTLTLRKTIQTIIRLEKDIGKDALYGLSIARASGIKSGTLYPILRRLVDEGWFTVTDVPQQGARARRVYSFTATGRASAKKFLRAHD